MVSDPIILLELAEMRCGHSARVSVDLAEAIGWEGRLIQLTGHVISEINVNNEWRCVDFDILGGGQIVKDANGSYLSFLALNHQHEKLDKLFCYGEASIYVGGDTNICEGILFILHIFILRKKHIMFTPPVVI
jgi:hypothetical protein